MIKSKKYDFKNPNQTGIIVNEPNEAYHINEALSHSQLNVFNDRPINFHKTFITQEIERKQTKAMLEGSLFHCATLEGAEVYETLYATEPEGAPPRPTPQMLRAEKKSAVAMERISFWDSFDFLHKGKTIITRDEDALAQRMKDIVWDNPVSSALLDMGSNELTYRTEKLGLGIQLQCKIDCVQKQGTPLFPEPYLVDLKKISNLSVIEKTMVDYGYWTQAAYYMKTIEAVLGKQPFKEFYFVFVESKEPHEMLIVRLHDSCIQMAMTHLTEDLTRFSKAYMAGQWPSYVDTLKDKTYLKPWRLEINNIDHNNIVTMDLPTSYYMKMAELS